MRSRVAGSRTKLAADPAAQPVEAVLPLLQARVLWPGIVPHQAVQPAKSQMVEPNPLHTRSMPRASKWIGAAHRMSSWKTQVMMTSTSTSRLGLKMTCSFRLHTTSVAANTYVPNAAGTAAWVQSATTEQRMHPWTLRQQGKPREGGQLLYQTPVSRRQRCQAAV